jgi:hypothetical protein
MYLFPTIQEPDGHDGRQEAELEAEASIIRM